MDRLGKIAEIKNEVEAICLQGELEKLGIPHYIQTHHDLAYDGLFQYYQGWGHVEAPAEHASEILKILDAIRPRLSEDYNEEGEIAD